MYVGFFTRCQSYRSYRRPSSWHHDLQDAAAAAAAAVVDAVDAVGVAVAAAVVVAAAVAAAAAADGDEDRCQTNLVAAARWVLSDAQRLEAFAAAGPSDPTSKGSTRLSSNWIFMVADCSADWRRAGEWNSRLEDRCEASGPVLIAALAIAALPLLKLFIVMIVGSWRITRESCVKLTRLDLRMFGHHVSV